jgi:hypothetical protein
MRVELRYPQIGEDGEHAAVVVLGGKQAESSTRSARALSPKPSSPSFSVFVPIAPATITAITTKAIQPQIASLRCRALHLRRAGESS